jgi:alkanesulfonate monooxygenase SsuD/methylene tetrahydromethanopterin reductase-like flavin-dependent oxidoreductase (luciferase family)
MPHQQRFRFGVLLGGRQRAGTWGDWAAVARGAENLGYSVLVMPDHLNGRARRLAEATALIRGALSDPCCTFAGDHYSVALRPPGLTCVQNRLPMLMGGGGPAILRLTASVADIVSVNPDLRAGSIPPLERGVPAETIDRQLGWVKAAAGPRYPDLEINVVLQVADVGAPSRIAGDGQPGGDSLDGDVPARRGGQPGRRPARAAPGAVGHVLRLRVAATTVAFAPVIARLAGR